MVYSDLNSVQEAVVLVEASDMLPTDMYFGDCIFVTLDVAIFTSIHTIFRGYLSWEGAIKELHGFCISATSMN